MPTQLDTRALNSIGSSDPIQYKTAFDALKTSVDNLQQPLANVVDGINSINKSLTQSSNAGDVFKKKIEDIASAFNAWKTISQVFDTLKISIAGAEAALTGGLSVALAAVTAFAPDIVNLFTSFITGKNNIDKATLSVNAMVDGFSSDEYKGAVKNVDLLKISFTQAKNKVIDKSKALEDYNSILGKSLGMAKTFEQADTILTKNSRAYTTAIAQRTGAMIKLKEAAEKSSDAEKEKLKTDQQTVGALTLEVPPQLAHQAAEEVKKENIKSSKRAHDDLKDTAEKLLTEIEKKLKDIRDKNDPIIQLKNRIAQLQKATDANIIGSNTFKQITKLKKGLNDLENPPKKKGDIGNNSSADSKRAQDEAKAMVEAEQLKRSSAARKLQITMQGYGNELLQENAHYDDQKKTLQRLYDDKLISQEKYNTVSQQLETEHHTVVRSLIDKFNTEDKEKIRQLTNETLELKIKNEKDGAQQQKDELNQQQAERNQQYVKVLEEEQKKKAAIESQINESDPGTDLTNLKTALDNQIKLIDLYGQKKEQEAEQTRQAIKKIDDDVASAAAKKTNDTLLKNDQKAISNADDPIKKQAAEKQLIADKYKFEIDQATLAGKDTTDLIKERDEEIKEIDDKYAKQKADDAKKQAQQLKDFELQAAQQVSNAAFSIVKNSISSQADAKIKQLETEKNSELANTSLTAAQKQAIQQDYQKKEAAVKAKAFKDEQLASIGQALINGALAVTKATAQTGVLAAFAIPAIIAETAVQVATIAAQKPPAYARGGVHYHSDGRGGVLAGYSRTDNTNAYLRSGEGIVVSEAMRVPWARNLVSAINVGFGGRDFSMSAPTRGFAVGGIFTDGGDANRYYNQPVHDQKNLANTIAYQMINNFPPVYVDVKDINNQQNILAQTINRVNL